MYAQGKKARGICDNCGFAYRLKQLKEMVVKGKRTGALRCPECWETSHPQLRLGELPVRDPQALRNPRPDNAEYAQSRALFVPVSGTIAFASAGYVTVVIT